jgi:hypothetical protein
MWELFKVSSLENCIINIGSVERIHIELSDRIIISLS